MCSLFAATYPERTVALVMMGTYAKRVWSEDYPWAPTAEVRATFEEDVRKNWGGPVGSESAPPAWCLTRSSASGGQRIYASAQAPVPPWRSRA